MQKLKKEEEDDFQSYIPDKEKTDSIPILTKYEKLKELDARISYQYPKGATSRPEIPQKTTEEFLSRRRKKRISEKMNQQEMLETLPILPETKKEQPKRSRIPFHPTEIPSPVHGFLRPAKTKIVEHELSCFTEAEITEQELKRLKLKNEVTAKTTQTTMSALQSDAVIQNKTERPETIMNDLPYTVVLPEKEAVSQIGSTRLEMKESVTIPKVEETSKHVEESITQVSDAEESKEEMGSVSKLTHQAAENPHSLDIKEDVLVNQQPPQRSRRTHLPFNVMMLKQDRLSWEARQRKLEEPKQTQVNRLEQQQELQNVSNTEEIQNVYSTERLQNVPNTEEIQNVYSTERLQNVPNTEEIQNVYRTERLQNVSNTEELQNVYRTERLQNVSNTEELQNVYSTERLQTNEFASSQSREAMDLIPQTSDSKGFQFPETTLLNPPVLEVKDTEWISGQQELLGQTLQNFNVGAKVVHVTQGPSVTRFEVQPDPGVKVNKITNLSDDIKLSLAARDIRIEAPIPGKHTIGIEVPNQSSRPVKISEIIQSQVFQTSVSPLTAVLGLDIEGNPIVTDLKKMPHGLIAGATGSGKSVCINSILVSLLYKASPEELKLLLIDPKMVELAPYNRIPHLVSPVITDVKAATAALKWAVEEMERRYELFAHAGVRDINRFNDLAMEHKRYADKLPLIVIIIDELADLMMMSPADVEEAICRIAQKARACGIHLILATQRPSVDVITGLIKANIPTRIAFSVSSQIDSRTIIDISGAEKLLGRGDMLFLENGSSKPVRLQGTFVTDEEIDLVVNHVRAQQEPNYLFEQEELLKKAQVTEGEDELFYEACEFIIDQGGASTSSLQRRFKIGYNRAARLMDMLEQNGYITGANGSKPREVLITEEELEAIHDSMTLG
nr:DNA translocase FtsK [Neobacillus endophyticus]